MTYGEYFPNPGLLGTGAGAFATVSLLQGMFAEAIGTAFLGFFVFAITDNENPARPSSAVFRFLSGLRWQ